MELLVNAGRHEIEWITPDALSVIERAGRTAHQSEPKGDPAGFVRKLISWGHESVLEHGSTCVRFKGVSRGLTHELVRHRLASFTQESTRYVNEREFRCVVPPHVDDAEKASMREAFERCEESYRWLRLRGVRPEDARQVLPTALESEIVVTANLREWRHILSLRCAAKAHWEIRRIMTQLLLHFQACNELSPVFEDLNAEHREDEAAAWGWQCRLCHVTKPLEAMGQREGWVCSICDPIPF